MTCTFSAVNDVRRLPDPRLREVLLADLQPRPGECRGFRDILECADDTRAVLVEPGDDIHRLTVPGEGTFDLTDFRERYYESIRFIADGTMIVAVEVGTWYYIPTSLLAAGDLALFRRQARRLSPV